ncbi:hypothetical protein TNCV_502861 [Trichonephila clavipes]|nr:hypothetical protein TNCV_502861 [Trichonephila clavipes]
MRFVQLAKKGTVDTTTISRRYVNSFLTTCIHSCPVCIPTDVGNSNRIMWPPTCLQYFEWLEENSSEFITPSLPSNSPDMSISGDVMSLGDLNHLPLLCGFSRMSWCELPTEYFDKLVEAAVAKGYRYWIVACLVTSSSPSTTKDPPCRAARHVKSV